MLKFIFSSIIIVALLAWLSYIPNSVIITYSNYQLSSTLTKLLFLGIIIFIPLYALYALIRLTYTAFLNKLYISSLMGMINSLHIAENKDIITNIIMYKPSFKFIRTIKLINKHIKNKNYDDALKLISAARKNKHNLLIFNRYLVEIYKATNHHTNIITTCRNSLTLNSKAYWFYKELLQVAITNNLTPEVLFLTKQLHKLDVDDKTYNNCYALLYYSLALHVHESNKEKALTYCNKIISVNKRFLPAYGFLLEHYNKENNNKKINEYLRTLWLAKASYESLKLWGTYYNDDTLIFAKKTIEDTKNPQDSMNQLLLATLHTKLGETLQAEDILSQLPDNSYKNLVYLNLINKTANYRKISTVIKNLNLQYSSQAWWEPYL
ncbi:HemY protein N-terminus domain containing protein [Candidatus Hepatincola sp. Pdp]